MLFSTVLLFLLLSSTSCLLFLPYIADTYIIPKIIKKLPFSQKEISLSRISPWQLRGSVYLADSGHDILALPGVELSFSLRSILKKRVENILIDRATLHLYLDQPVKKNDQDHQSARKENSTLPFLFPVACNTLAIRNSTVILHRGEREQRLTINGQISFNFKDLTNGKKRLVAAKAYFSSSGSLPFSTTLQLQQKEEDNTILLALSSTDISGIDYLIPELSPFNPGGHFSLSTNLGIKNLTQITGLQATAELSGNSSSTPLTIRVQGDSEKMVHFSVSTGSFSLNKSLPLLFSPIFASGEVNIGPEKISGHISGSIPRLTLTDKKTTLKNISLSLPFQFPLSGQNSDSGIITIDKILYGNTPGGSLKGQITLNRTGAKFSTQIKTSVPDLQIQCTGSIDLKKQGEASCTLPETYLDSATLPPFFHLPPKFSFSGNFSAESTISSTDGISTGNLSLRLNNGTMNISGAELSAIDMAVTLQDFPRLQSEPGQICTIKKIELGDIKLSDARINFRIEDSHSIFIEKSRFSWCDGKVESGSLRLSTAEKEVAATLYCDRLKFTSLLSQFGIEDAEGDGTLNGRLPLLLSKNNIEFDDGFLFSTPGEGGVVRFNNTAQLRRGMGAIDQTPYLDYSMQALENFSYNWARLTFNSDDKDLLVKMEIDGKPAISLPFRYRKGLIVPSRKGQGLQHPIRLDINFRLPLTDLFKYGRKM